MPPTRGFNRRAKMTKKWTTVCCCLLTRNRRLGSLVTRNSSLIALCALTLSLCARPIHAQSPALLLGNPQITPGLQAQGFVIQRSVSQTATATTVTYNVTPPTTGSNGQVGAIYWDLVSSGSSIVTFTITWNGNLGVAGSWSGGGFQGGATRTQAVVALRRARKRSPGLLIQALAVSPLACFLSSLEQPQLAWK